MDNFNFNFILCQCSDDECIKKWQRAIIYNIEKSLLLKLCIFLEKYNIMQDYYEKHQYNFLSYIYPDGFFILVDVIKMLNSCIEKNMNYMRLTIKREYYNILTLKKGIELETNIFIEDGIIIKNNKYLKLMSNLEKDIDDEIRYILDISYRKLKIRKDKLNIICNC